MHRRHLHVSTLLLVGICGWSLLASGLFAQATDAKVVHGDSTLKTVITPQTRAIYEQGGTSHFLMTQKNLLGLKEAYATEVRAIQSDGRVNRVIASAWTKQGRYSAEYYLSDNRLLLMYETFEYFTETAAQPAWRNFKGFAAWERRSYFDDGRIGYAETRGHPAWEVEASSAQARVERVIDQVIASTR